jgi:hypothetical protein
VKLLSICNLRSVLFGAETSTDPSEGNGICVGFGVAGTCGACSCTITGTITDRPADEATKQAAHGAAQQTAHRKTVGTTNTTTDGSADTCALVAAHISAQPATLV